MSKPKVLIVGCGAVGLSQGYQLSAGADITYLVRPGRKPAFTPPKQLYSYKEDALHTFSSYRVIESVQEISGETFAFIFDTLDGHTARSESGTATLRAVGDFANEPQNSACFVAYDAMGLDIEAHYTRTMRLARTRIFQAGSMLAHQPTPRISVPASATNDLVARAHLLYASMPPNVGLMAMNTQPALTAKLDALYTANGKLAVQRIPAFMVAWAPALAVLHLMTWNIEGFGPFEQLRANTELWTLMLRAQCEILTLPRFGWTGWAVSWVFGSWATMKMNMMLVQGAKPIRLEEFNAFHHGTKVAKQDVAMLEDLVREGERTGRKMVALREIVARVNKIYS